MKMLPTYQFWITDKEIMHNSAPSTPPPGVIVPARGLCSFTPTAMWFTSHLTRSDVPPKSVSSRGGTSPYLHLLRQIGLWSLQAARVSVTLWQVMLFDPCSTQLSSQENWMLAPTLQNLGKQMTISDRPATRVAPSDLLRLLLPEKRKRFLSP